MINSDSDSEYADILVETYENHGEPSATKVRVRPVDGQDLPTGLHVECSRKLRKEYPVGSMFIIRAKLTNRLGGAKFLYTNHSWPFQAVSNAEAKRFMASRTRK